MAPPRKPLPPHGTLARLSHRREPCRPPCELCLEAKRDYQARWQRRRRGLARPYGTNHWPKATCRHCGGVIFQLEPGAPWRHWDKPVYGMFRCSLDDELPVAEPAPPSQDCSHHGTVGP